MKKRLLGIIVLLTAILTVVGFGIAAIGEDITVGDPVTSELPEVSSDPIVLNNDDAQSPSPSPSPVESPADPESGSGSEESDVLIPLSGSSSGGGLGIQSIQIASHNSTDNTPPSSMVNFFTDTDEESEVRECEAEEEGGVKKAYLNYDDVVGHGTSADSMTKIIEVHTKLDSRARNNGVCNDGACNERQEDWHTGTLYFNLAEGWHNLWGSATDARSNNETFSNANLCMFCIDTHAPGQPSKPGVVREEVCDPFFASGEEITFSWEAGDSGCAGVSFFDVFVEIDVDGEITKDTRQVSGPRVTIEGLEHGNKVRISVQPTDKAGNQGPVSEWSDWITIDNIRPELEILNKNADEWIMGNLEVTENDSDENLFKCFYKVQSGFLKEGGEVTVDWAETPCNQAFMIDTVQVCPRDGVNQCIVFKKAQDKACNERTRSKQFDVDNHGPALEKIIGEPKYFDGKFLRKSTPITVIATDLGAGVNETCYRFTNVQTGFVEERCAGGGQIELRFWDNESQHDLMFWATDLKGMETRMNQTHFVDETPPMTMKIYSILFQKIGEWMGIENFTMDWIGPNTKIMLNATDPLPHPSGLQKTLFKLFLLDEEEEGHTEWYGMKTKTWYESEEECEEGNMAPVPEPSPMPPVNESNMSNQNESQYGNGIGIGNGKGNCVAVSGWENHAPLEEHDSEDGWQVYNGEGIMIPQGHDFPHKICFKSVDNVWNWEMQQCQVFFVDATPPVIEPLKLPDHQCQKIITARITDRESGVKRAWVEWIKMNGNETIVLRKDMTFSSGTRMWDATFLANDLGMLMVGNYTVRIKAEDGAGNMAMADLTDALMRAVCVLSIMPRQCNLDSSTGGNCMFNFNVMVRGGNAVQMGMDNLFALSPQNLSAMISNNLGTKAVGNDMLWNGGILQVNNTGGNRGSFKLSLDIPPTVTGEETLDYFLRPEIV